MTTQRQRREAAEAAAEPIRQSLRDEAKCCERCGRRCLVELHEILRGALRIKAIGERCAILCLCRDCHRGKGADTGMGGKSWEYQLAILYLNRQADFDLARFHAIAGRCKPDQSEVDEQVQVLLLQGR